MNQENNFIKDQETFSFNGFSLTTNANPAIDASKTYQFTDSYTIDNIVELENEEIVKNKDLTVNVDYSNPSNFVKYSSFTELIRYSIEDIILRYPASLHIMPNLVGYDYGDVNISDIAYNQNSDKTVFTISTNYISNPFLINYSSDFLNTNRNLINLYANYVFEYEGVEYDISSINLSEKLRNSKLTLEVLGNPFNGLLVNRVDAYIRPKMVYKKKVIAEGFTGVQRYMLNDSFTFLAFKDAESGDSFEYDLKFSIPKYDLHNLDFFSDRYKRFLESLFEFTNSYDEVYSNISSRLLISDSIQDITLSSNGRPKLGESNILINTISSYFDQIYSQIKGYKFYDFIEYETIGKSQNEINDRLRNQGLDVSVNIDVISEDLKYLLIHLPDLLNKKGTRDAIIFLFNYLNIPTELVQFDEHIYRTTSIDYNALEFLYSKISPDFLLSSVPLNRDGSPNLSKIESHFQSSGYFKELKNLLPSLSNYFLINSGTTTDAEILYQNDFNISGETEFNVDILNLNNFSGSPCYDFTTDIVPHPLPEMFVDDCGCPLDVDDLAFRMCMTPLDVYEGECPLFVIDVVPECVASPLSGDTISGFTECNYGISLISKNFVADKVTPAVIENGVLLGYDVVLAGDCIKGETTPYNIVSTFSLCYENSRPLLASGYLTTIRLYDSINNSPIDLNISPINTPYLNGCSGNVNVQDLYFPSGGNTASYTQALTTVIENGICSAFPGLPSIPQNGADYFLDVEVTNGGVITLSFGVKHNPSFPNYIIGINTDDAVLSYLTPNVSASSNAVVTKLSSPDIFETQEVNCISGDTLQISKSVDGDDLISRASVSYNSIILNNNSDIDTFEINSVLNGTCLIEGDISGEEFQYGANLNINVYGGTPPYNFIGLQDGQYLASGQTYSVFAIDASGCTSNVFSGEVICNLNPCLGSTVQTTTQTVTTIETVSNTEFCDLTIPYQLSYELVEIISDQLTFQYTFEAIGIDENLINSHSVAAFFTDRDDVLVGTLNTASTEREQTGQVVLTYDFLTSGIFLDITHVININYGEYECEYEGNILAEYNIRLQGVISENGVLNIIKENIEVETTTEETIVELVPNQPNLIATYECIVDSEGNNTGQAQISIEVEGGTPDFQYFGAMDGDIVDDGQSILVFVIDSLGCKSNEVLLVINCPNEEVECNVVTLNTALETTSVDTQNNTATVTFSYEVLDLAFDQEVVNVQLVSSGINGTENYLVGGPVVSSFTGDVGAEQLFLDFDPFVNDDVDIKFFITITTDDGCIYTHIFNLGVDASQLSSTDTYLKELS